MCVECGINNCGCEPLPKGIRGPRGFQGVPGLPGIQGPIGLITSIV